MDNRTGPVKLLPGITITMPIKNEEKAKRLSAALRENLRKRKTQADGRDVNPPADVRPVVHPSDLPPAK